MREEANVTKEKTLKENEIRERISSILNRDPRPLEEKIFNRMWNEECSGKYSRPLLSELPSQSQRSVREYPRMLELGDNYQMLFQVSTCQEDTESAFAEKGARSVASAFFCHGDRDDHLRSLVGSQALYAYAFGIPVLNVFRSGIPQKTETVNIASIALLRNKKFPETTLRIPGSEIWWVQAQPTENPDEAQVRRIRLHEMMITLSSHAWLLATSHVLPSGLLCTLTGLAGEGRLGMLLEAETWKEDPEEFLFKRNPGGFLVCFRRTFEREVKEVINRYDALGISLGRSTGNGKLTILTDGEETAEMPFELLRHYSGEPIGHNESERVLEVKNKRTRKDENIPEPEDYTTALKKLLESPKIRYHRKAPSFVDSTIRGNTVKIPAENPVIRLKGSHKLLTLSMAMLDYYHERDSHTAAYNAVVQASRKVACTGAEVLGAASSFMEGDPEKGRDYFHLLDAVRGVAGAAKALKIPITGSDIQWGYPGVYESPLVAAAGLLESKNQCVEPGFKDDGDFICILGSFRGELESSEYVRFVHGINNGRIVPADGDFTSHLNMALLQAAREQILKSALDMETGGLAVALVKSSLLHDDYPMGCDIYTMRKMRDDALLFGESTSTVLITLEEHKLMDMERIANDFGVACTTVGRVRDHGRMTINDLIDVELDSLRGLICV